MEKENKNMKYKVCVDDNFHYQDESERFTHGEYETAEQAIQIAKEITDESLKSLYKIRILLHPQPLIQRSF